MWCEAVSTEYSCFNHRWEKSNSRVRCLLACGELNECKLGTGKSPIGIAPSWRDFGGHWASRVFSGLFSPLQPVWPCYTCTWIIWPQFGVAWYFHNFSTSDKIWWMWCRKWGSQVFQFASIFWSCQEICGHWSLCFANDTSGWGNFFLRSFVLW